ncbi:putative spermidine/putrescine transport system ATP-binding protein [Bradyrhizobium sp. LA6.10]|uniref:ABC transporter ATP-binding protein n=1 Tax=Bradyrhizobium sp. LA6.10 TaxID=3156318 RepID=UPI0033924A3C
MFDVELVGVRKQYGEFCALGSVSLAVKKGEFLTLLGPSGCGKTTLMKIIAGLIEPTEGKVCIRGENVTRRPPYARDMSLMFQNYALFPHKTVFDNVAFGLKYRGVDAATRAQKVREALELIKLPGIENRYPGQLSGGQQQRIALARSLVVNPAVLLLDEPLSNLDEKLRADMRVELKQIQERLSITFIFVTHDQGEALAMSDRIVVMNAGKVLQIGEPREIYNAPASVFVADFLGKSNFFEGNIAAVSGTEINVQTINGHNLKGHIRRGVNVVVGEKMTIQVRAEKVRLLLKAPQALESNVIAGSIERSVYEGIDVTHQVRLTSGEVISVNERASAHEVPQGVPAWITFGSEDAVVLPH